jgi:hypothetical protein
MLEFGAFRSSLTNRQSWHEDRGLSPTAAFRPSSCNDC